MGILNGIKNAATRQIVKMLAPNTIKRVVSGGVLIVTGWLSKVLPSDEATTVAIENFGHSMSEIAVIGGGVLIAAVIASLGGKK